MAVLSGAVRDRHSCSSWRFALLSTDAAIDALQAGLEATDVGGHFRYRGRGLVRGPGTGAVFLDLWAFSNGFLPLCVTGAGRLVLDIVMARDHGTRARSLPSTSFSAPRHRPCTSGWSHPFFLVAATGWLFLFFAVFLVPGLAYRRLDPLPTLREAWDHHVQGRNLISAMPASRSWGSLLIGPLALVLPSLQLLP